ncbi:Macrophage migration inhibitory factor [Rhynchospora pubera]|uniref:Macrophage migration inhibitory factor n=1 Tax=Rhynchospora pubera TaxID=906938 RepID=A0AAV8GUI2_9POAL|nr:Macrophage migration inhibitory factor [Rhynchospora pubera]
MPCLTLSTNVNLDGVDTSAILAEATRVVADVIDKPQNYVMVVLKGSVPICFGGTEQPAAYGELVSIGGVDPVTNKKISSGIATILSKMLSIPKSRFFLLFFDTRQILHKNLLTVCMLYIRSKFNPRTLDVMRINYELIFSDGGDSTD